MIQTTTPRWVAKARDERNQVACALRNKRAISRLDKVLAFMKDKTFPFVQIPVDCSQPVIITPGMAEFRRSYLADIIFHLRLHELQFNVGVEKGTAKLASFCQDLISKIPARFVVPKREDPFLMQFTALEKWAENVYELFERSILRTSETADPQYLQDLQAMEPLAKKIIDLMIISNFIRSLNEYFGDQELKELLSIPSLDSLDVQRLSQLENSLANARRNVGIFQPSGKPWKKYLSCLRERSHLVYPETMAELRSQSELDIPNFIEYLSINLTGAMARTHALLVGDFNAGILRHELVLLRRDIIRRYGFAERKAARELAHAQRLEAIEQAKLRRENVLAEKQKRKEITQTVKCAVKIGIPRDFVAFCITRNILDIDRILSLHSKKDAYSVNSRVRSSGSKSAPFSPEKVTQDLIELAFGKPLDALVSNTRTLLESSLPELHVFLQIYYDYLQKSKGDRGSFSQNGRLTSCSFRARQQMRGINYNGWQFFALQQGDSRIVVAVDLTSNSVCLYCAETAHDRYNESIVSPRLYFQSAVRLL